MTDGAFSSIEDHGVVGNLQTCALVSREGAVDWFPFPHVESPSMFAALLDPDVGGRFGIRPTGPFESGQQYVDRTNVLRTTFRTGEGAATITDFMPPAEQTDHPSNVLYRKVECVDGSVDLAVEFDPQFDYARAETTVEPVGPAVHAEGGDERAILETEVDLALDGGAATGTLSMDAGEVEWLVLRCTGAEDADTDPDAALEATVDYWRDWCDRCTAEGAEPLFDGPWADLAIRSALVLKLLTHQDSGAVVAAPTTSLPEDLGGTRNWDYRFTWLRDAGFTVQALSNLGHTDEASSYVDWFLDLCRAKEPAEIQPMYGVHGDADLTERTLDHLSGYHDSRPVRIGNGAVAQFQLDSYGELVLAIEEALVRGKSIDGDDWATVRSIVEYVREVWTEPDAGIWEVRGDERHFVYSKVMCWVALDRGIAIATDGDWDAPIRDWRATRDAIATEVLERGYDEDVGSFVQSYGDDALDATALLFPVLGFLPFDDERMQSTVDAVQDRLLIDDALVRRYDGEDGLPGEEGAFVLCSTWLVDALLLSGRVEEARDRFRSLLDHVSDLGLLAEEIDPKTERHLGNYPQAFSHLGVIDTVLYFGYVDGGDAVEVPPMGIRLGDPVGLDAEASGGGVDDG